MNIVAIGVVCLILPLLGSAQFLDPACGIRSGASLRVMNGTVASLKSSPWMAFLYSTTGRFMCGGTLISNRLVLTAAHCFRANTTFTNLIARLGEYNRRAETKCYGSYCTTRIEAKVERGIRHKLYHPKTMLNDIAMLKLIKRVKYKENIRPICIVLDTKWRNFIDSIDPLTGTGWGKSESEGDSTILRTVDLRRQDPKICFAFTGRHITKKQFCAGNWQSNLCNGDSGGPVGALVSYHNSERFIQIGIASFNNHNCTRASAFTDVLTYADWILKAYRLFS